MLRIGKKIENVTYTKREASYVIIERKEDDKVAIVTDGTWFLLGGGIEKEENELEALRREVVEEAGYSIKNIRYFDMLTAWADGGKRGPLDVTATIFVAEFDQKIAEPIEETHTVFWVNPEQYQNKLFHEYQRYALKKYIELKKNRRKK